MFLVAMFSTLLQDGNKEAKTSVVLRFAKWTVIPQLSNYKLQHQFFLLIFLQFPFSMTLSWTCTLALSCHDNKNSTVLTPSPIHKSN